MVQADSTAAEWSEKSGAMQMMMREIEHTYTTMMLRAAYRAGMSTAAAICDENHARLIGDKIMAARYLIDVPRDVLSGDRTDEAKSTAVSMNQTPPPSAEGDKG